MGGTPGVDKGEEEESAQDPPNYAKENYDSHEATEESRDQKEDGLEPLSHAHELTSSAGVVVSTPSILPVKHRKGIL